MMVNIKINGFDYQVPAGSTILEAAHSVGIEIPTLCYLKGIISAYSYHSNSALAVRRTDGGYRIKELHFNLRKSN